MEKNWVADFKDSQGSDAEDSSSNNEDSRSNEEKICRSRRLLESSLFLKISLC